MARINRSQIGPDHFLISRLLAPLVTATNPDGTPYALPTTEGVYEPLGYRQVTGLGTAQSLTVPTGATLAIIQPEAQAVRWRDDGTAPTATVGMRAEVGSQLRYSGDLSAIRFIEVAVGAVLNVAYYRS